VSPEPHGFFTDTTVCIAGKACARSVQRSGKQRCTEGDVHVRSTSDTRRSSDGEQSAALDCDVPAGVDRGDRLCGRSAALVEARPRGGASTADLRTSRHHVLTSPARPGDCCKRLAASRVAPRGPPQGVDVRPHTTRRGTASTWCTATCRRPSATDPTVVCGEEACGWAHVGPPPGRRAPRSARKHFASWIDTWGSRTMPRGRSHVARHDPLVAPVPREPTVDRLPAHRERPQGRVKRAPSRRSSRRGVRDRVGARFEMPSRGPARARSRRTAPAAAPRANGSQRSSAGQVVSSAYV